MLDKNTLIKVTNRDNGSIGYSIPDLGNLQRRFESGETKEVSMEELRKLSYTIGGSVILKEYLLIHNKEAVEELLGTVEPEYYYGEEDVKNLKRIAYLRTLGISIEDIRRISNKEADLLDIIKKQKRILEQELSELENAKMMCERMLSSKENVEYEDLDIERHVINPKEYWTQ